MAVAYFMQEYLQALAELAPDSTRKKQSVEAAKQAALQLEEVRHKLEVERAIHEDNIKIEREGML